MKDIIAIDTIADATVAGQYVRVKGELNITDILFYYHGTNQAGQTAAASTDLGGHLYIKETGEGNVLRDIVSLTRPQFLMTYWETFFGWLPETSVAEGAYKFVLAVPFHVSKYDHNAYFLPEGKMLEIQVPTLDSAGDHIDSVACTVYACYDDMKFMRHVPRLMQQRMDVAAQNKEGLPNGTAVVITTSATTTDPNYINFLQGKTTRRDLAFPAAYLLYQVLQEDMEAAPTMTGDTVHDFTNNGRDLSAAIGNDWQIETIDGTGYIEVFSFAVDMEHPDRLAASRAHVGAKIAETRIKSSSIGITPEMHGESVTPSEPGKVKTTLPVVVTQPDISQITSSLPSGQVAINPGGSVATKRMTFTESLKNAFK